MQFWFVDDARQRAPTRERMGPLCAAGAIRISEDNLKRFETALDTICEGAGFPNHQEFKWSPGRELWMHDNLRDDARRDFFLRVIQCARDHDVLGVFAAVDTDFRPVTGADSHELDVVRLLIERIHNSTPANQWSLIIADTPSGGAVRINDKFVSDCLETLRVGTNAIATLDRISMVLTCSSHLTRCLQFADVFTSCLTAFVSGERRWSPPVAAELGRLLRSEGGRIGGCGVKLHPDYVYANLYHWLFGDEHFWRFNCGTPLPLEGRPYASNPAAYRE